MVVLRVLLVVMSFGLVGCNWSGTLDETLLPDEARPVFDAAKALVLEGDQDSIAPHWYPEVDLATIPGIIEQIQGILPDAPAESVDLVNIARFSGEDPTLGSFSQITVTYIARWPDQHFSLVAQVTRLEEGPWQLNRFRIDPINAALEGPATIEDWGLARSIWVGITALVIAFILLTLVSLYRFRRVKRRILWTIFIIAGCFPVFAMDWATASWWLESPALHSTEGTFRLSLFEFKILGAAFARAGIHAPWIAEVCVPIGALFFWYRVMRGGPTRREHLENRPR